MSVYTELEQQYPDLSGLEEKKFLIPIGEYLATVEVFKDLHKEDEDTKFGVPGRPLAVYTLHLTNDEGNTYRWPFFKATPKDFRKRYGEDTWYAPGDPEHKDISKCTEMKNWKWLTSFDKKGKLNIVDQHKTIQETTYKMRVGRLYKKGDETIWAKNVDDEDRAKALGYELAANTIVNMYPRKDTAV